MAISFEHTPLWAKCENYTTTTGPFCHTAWEDLTARMSEHEDKRFRVTSEDTVYGDTIVDDKFFPTLTEAVAEICSRAALSARALLNADGHLHDSLGIDEHVTDFDRALMKSFLDGPMKNAAHQDKAIATIGETIQDLAPYSDEDLASLMQDPEFLKEAIELYESHDFTPKMRPLYEEIKGVIDEAMDKKAREIDTILEAMEAAGYTYDTLESHDGYQHFFGEGTSMTFDTLAECKEWLQGVVFDDPELNDIVDGILNGVSDADEKETTEMELPQEMKQYNISFERRGVYQANLIEAPSEAIAEAYYTKTHPDARVFGIHHARSEDKRPGKPVIQVPQEFIRDFQEKKPKTLDDLIAAADRSRSDPKLDAKDHAGPDLAL